jgi:hypothetical protein
MDLTNLINYDNSFFNLESYLEKMKKIDEKEDKLKNLSNVNVNINNDKNKDNKEKENKNKFVGIGSIPNNATIPFYNTSLKNIMQLGKKSLTELKQIKSNHSNDTSIIISHPFFPLCNFNLI